MADASPRLTVDCSGFVDEPTIRFVGTTEASSCHRGPR